METCKGKHCSRLDRQCIEHECTDYIQVLGKDPQTDEPLNFFDCVIRWQLKATLENSKLQRETGAAIESLRNEVSAGANSLLLKALLGRLPHMEDK